MLTYITSAIISFILLVVVSLTTQPPMHIELWLLGLALAATFVFGSVACMILSDFLPSREVMTESLALASFRGADGRPVVFVAAALSANEEQPVYNYLVKREDGSLLHAHIAVADVTIIEDPTLTASGQLMAFVSKAEPSSRLRHWTLTAFKLKDTRYEFRVPVGTVLT